MKVRAVFSVADMQAVKSAMGAARGAGVEDDDISLIARSDISLEKIPDDRQVAEGDFYPAAIRGALGGGTVGLLAGVVAMVAAPIGLTLAGVAGIALAGASLGSWATALAGSSVTDPVRRKFEAEIEAGRILVIVDGEQEVIDGATDAICATGAQRLPFDEASAMS